MGNVRPLRTCVRKGSGKPNGGMPREGGNEEGRGGREGEISNGNLGRAKERGRVGRGEGRREGSAECPSLLLLGHPYLDTLGSIQ